MKHVPYDYQHKTFDDTIAAIQHCERRIMVNLPTRAGKSIIACMLVEAFSGESIYFIAHKKILITQMSEELTENGIQHGIIAPWAPQLRYRVQVISKDTFYNRYKTMASTGWKPPKLIIVDEAHMSQGARYKEILDAFPESILIGLTATVIRLDGRPFRPMFEHLIKGPSISELQKKERLCEIDTFVADFDDSGIRTRAGDYVTGDVLEKVDKPAVISNLVSHWETFAKGKKTLTFCASIKHAQDVAEQFNEAGYPSIALSSKSTSQELKEKVQAYYRGEYINLVSVDLFLMGFTVKDCGCILQARPTQSLMVYLQALGRGMVWLPRKKLINLDCVNNYIRHGLPDDDREWTLDGATKKAKEIASLKKCPACFRPVPVATRVCEHCGYQWTETENAGVRMPEEKTGKLVKIERDEWNDLIRNVARNARCYDDAVRIAGDKADEIWHQWLKNA